MKLKITLITFVFPAAALLAQSYTVATVAGNGQPPSSVPAVSVRVPVSGAIAMDNAGEVYFTSGDSVLRVDTKGVLTHIAGTGAYGLSTDGIPAVGAQLEWPAGLALDASGNLFITENAAHRIRKVSPTGVISTVAGTGSSGFSGDNGPATSAQLNWPTALALDAAGNLYIADSANGRIRRVSTDGTITTVATGLHNAEGVAADAAGNLYVADYEVTDDFDCCDGPQYSGSILKITPNGTTSTLTPSVSSTSLLEPQGLTLDSAGNLYIADAVGGTIIEISSSGVITTPVGSFNAYGGQCPNYYSDQTGSSLLCPGGVVVDSTGNLYISDTGHSRIAKVSPQGALSSVVGDGRPGNYWGDGGKATDAALETPLGVALDKAGNLYIADTANSRVRKVSPAGIITTVAGTGISGYSGDGGPATSAQLKGPAGLAFDASGNLYIADYLDNRIRKLSPNGTITTVAGRGDSNSPLGDGGPATNAALARPLGVAVDANGNLYIADSSFFLVRKVTPAGIISTIAGTNYYVQGVSNIGLPTGVAVDASGNVFIAAANLVRKLAPDGSLSVVAGTVGGGGVGAPALTVTAGDGGPATSATLWAPVAVSVDAAGDLYISGGALSGFPALGLSGYVRKVTPNGIIATIAGNGSTGYSGDGGPATSASFSASAGGIAVDPGGNLFVADIFNNVIRVLRLAGQ